MPNIVESVDHLNEDDLEENKELKFFEMTEQSLIELKKILTNAEENTRSLLILIQNLF